MLATDHLRELLVTVRRRYFLGVEDMLWYFARVRRILGLADWQRIVMIGPTPHRNKGRAETKKLNQAMRDQDAMSLIDIQRRCIFSSLPVDFVDYASYAVLSHWRAGDRIKNSRSIMGVLESIATIPIMAYARHQEFDNQAVIDNTLGITEIQRVILGRWMKANGDQAVRIAVEIVWHDTWNEIGVLADAMRDGGVPEFVLGYLDPGTTGPGCWVVNELVEQGRKKGYVEKIAGPVEHE